MTLIRLSAPDVANSGNGYFAAIMAKLPQRTVKVRKSARPRDQQRSNKLFTDLRDLVEKTRAGVAATVNIGLTMMYWKVGQRITQEILIGGRGKYGDEMVIAVSRKLCSEYGDGFSEKNLRRMLQFVKLFPDERIVVTLSRQLSWSHFTALLPIKDGMERSFYAEMCRHEQWSVRALRERIDGMLYHRTAIAKRPAQVIKKDLKLLSKGDRLTPDLVFRDPYIVRFLKLGNNHTEKDLEDAILGELQTFILELGSDFTFVARQHRIIVDGEDHYLDLLFYHRSLRRLVAIELKLGAFKASDKGLMELYLRWLSKHETRPGEKPPLGLILCTDAKQETIELLELAKSRIRVAEYMVDLPPRKELQRKLHQAVQSARKRLGA